MKIAWGVNGYGRGHATRVEALLEELGGGHDVLLLAGGDAWEALRGAREPVRIPALGFCYRGARISWRRTLAANSGLVADILGGGPVTDEVTEHLRAFRPDVVVSDSEPFVLRAAARLGVRTVGLDHVGVIAWCRPEAPLRDRLRLGFDGAIYRCLFGRPDRIVVSSFYAPPARAGNVVVVPPILRPVVLKAIPTDGNHLLVYLNRGEHLYTPRVHATLRALGGPVLVFGAPRSGRDGNVAFRPLAEEPFVEALASCRAVMATAGHQLVSEALHLGKPMLLVPEDSAEQRLNAREAVRLGVARVLRHAAISPRSVREFLDGLPAHRAALDRFALDAGTGAEAAVDAMLGMAPPAPLRVEEPEELRRAISPAGSAVPQASA